MSDEGLIAVLICAFAAAIITGGVLYYMHAEHTADRIAACVLSGKPPATCKQLFEDAEVK